MTFFASYMCRMQIGSTVPLAFYLQRITACTHALLCPRHVPLATQRQRKTHGEQVYGIEWHEGSPEDYSVYQEWHALSPQMVEMVTYKGIAGLERCTVNQDILQYGIR